MLITDEIFQLFVTETNWYAHQEKNKKTVKKQSRIRNWKDTDQEEMEKFIGSLMWLGLLQLPSLASYWSKNVLYENSFKKTLSRNRFQIMLKMWHFVDNERVNPDDRLYKIGPLLRMLQKSFQTPITPGEVICIDETLVPFKGRLKFKQYISNKRYKFGIKLFKLCLDGGYLYDLKVYCGQEKEASEEYTVPSKVVLDLTKDLLNSRRTIVVDNYYASVELAHKLLELKTNIIGTLRANRKNNPKQVLQEKLKRGETAAQESNTGVIVEKWRDKREILMLNTKFVPDMITISKKSGDVQKPKIVIEYNKHKTYIDISDQMKSYNSSLRRGVKWYRKLAIELTIGVGLVNAYYLHQKTTHNKMSITKFREEVIRGLLKLEEETHLEGNKEDNHVLVDTSTRRSCSLCYSRISAEHGRLTAKNKTPKTKLLCEKCSKHFCLECFFEKHSAVLK